MLNCASYISLVAVNFVTNDQTFSKSVAANKLIDLKQVIKSLWDSVSSPDVGK